MGYGQYAETTGKRWTKAEQLDALGIDPEGVESRKVGHNRTEVTFPDGEKWYVLHRTSVARLHPDGETVTLRDGGWPTKTTRRAMTEALERWGFRHFAVASASTNADHTLMTFRSMAAPPELDFTSRITVHLPSFKEVE